MMLSVPSRLILPLCLHRQVLWFILFLHVISRICLVNIFLFITVSDILPNYPTTSMQMTPNISLLKGFLCLFFIFLNKTVLLSTSYYFSYCVCLWSYSVKAISNVRSDKHEQVHSSINLIFLLTYISPGICFFNRCEIEMLQLHNVIQKVCLFLSYDFTEL
jgi:hypothetical protein